MPRYIDVDKLYKSEIERCHCVPLVGSCTNDNKSLRDVLDNAPTADVVQRSEVVEEVLAKVKELVKEYMLDKGLYLATLKHALNYAEKIIKGAE